MKAVRLYGIEDLRVEEVCSPSLPGPDEALVRVLAAGICGSDLHNFTTGQWITRTPTIPGHELTGIVEAVGSDVHGLSAGDHVVADSRVWCGACAHCRKGRRNLCQSLGFVGEVCDGGFTQKISLPARLLHKVSEAIEPRVAAMVEPIAVALHAIARLQAEPHSPVLVVGCGTIGGLAALLLSQIHSGPIFVADRNEDRANLVANIARAQKVILDRDALRRVLGDRFLEHAIEATGSVVALRAAIDCVDAGSTVACVGIYHEQLSFNPSLLVEREISLVGCHAFAGELGAAIAMLPALSSRLIPLIDDEVGLDGVAEAYARMRTGAVRGLKTIVRP